MGFTIARVLEPDQLMFHLNGAYHNKNNEGILWYLEKYRPGLRMITLSTVLQSDVSALTDENRGISDFILVVDESMTRTY